MLPVSTILETFATKTLAQNALKNLTENIPKGDTETGFKVGQVGENFFTAMNSTIYKCRPDPSFPEAELISAYAGLLIMFIMAIYSR